jgi:phosphatidylserine decarboxylase
VVSDQLIALKHRLLPKHFLTFLSGVFANTRLPWIKNYFIRTFISHFKVNMSEARVEQPEDYPTFNDFFIRHLKPELRPISTARIVSPVDGRVSALGQIHVGMLMQAKGRTYSVSELLSRTEAECAAFERGSYMTLYLSPKDYHRIHMPISAKLLEMVHVPGTLFSVQPETTRVIPKLFAKNERLIVFFETELGRMAMVLVGATIVGAIGTSWHGDLKRSATERVYRYSGDDALEKAAEMGYFKLGSTVILLFDEQSQVLWNNALSVGSSVKMGQSIV